MRRQRVWTCPSKWTGLSGLKKIEGEELQVTDIWEKLYSGPPASGIRHTKLELHHEQILHVHSKASMAIKRRGSSCNMTSLVFRSSLSKETSQQIPWPRQIHPKKESSGCQREKHRKAVEKKRGNSPLPKKNLVPLGSEYLLDIWCRSLDSWGGPQKNWEKKGGDKHGRSSPRDNHNDEGKKTILTTPTSVWGCFSTMDGKTRSQLGRPKWVGARREVIASFSAPTSWT